MKVLTEAYFFRSKEKSRLKMKIYVYGTTYLLSTLMNI